MALERFLNGFGIELPKKKHHLSRRTLKIFARMERISRGGSNDPRATQLDLETIRFMPPQTNSQKSSKR